MEAVWKWSRGVMKEFLKRSGKRIYVNPANVAHAEAYADGIVRLYFASEYFVAVQGTLTEVVEYLGGLRSDRPSSDVSGGELED